MDNDTLADYWRDVSPNKIAEAIAEILSQNKKQKKVIDNATNKLKQLDENLQNSLCVNDYMGGSKTKNLINELKDILKEVSE